MVESTRGAGRSKKKGGWKVLGAREKVKKRVVESTRGAGKSKKKGGWKGILE